MLYTLTSFIASLSTIGIGIFVLTKNTKSLIHRYFFLLTFVLFIWIFGCFGQSVVPAKNLALILDKIIYTGVIFYPLCFLYFIFYMLYLDISKKRILFNFLEILVLSFLFFNYFDPLRIYFVKDVAKAYPFRFIASPSFIWFVLLAYEMCVISYGFIILILELRKSTGLKLHQLRYLLLAFSVLTIGGLMYFGLVINIYTPPIDNLLVVVASAIIAYAIIKYRLMDIRIAITRAGIFLVLYTCVLGLPFYVGYATHSWVLSTSFAVVLATAGPLIYRILQIKAENILLAQQRHYQHMLLQAAGGMVREHSLERLLKLIVHIVKKVVKIRYAAIYVHRKKDKIYTLESMRGYKIDSDELQFNEDSPFIVFMKEKLNPFTYEEMPPKVRTALTKHLKTSFDLVVPSAIQNEILGFLVLGEKLDKSPYSQDDINVFRILSHQASLAIENCLFFEEFKQVQQQLFQAEKLASIGGMADGVAHQIKNRLNHFSLASGELKLAIQDFIDKNPEPAHEATIKGLFDYLLQLTDSIISNVKKTDGVVKGILDFARTTEKETFWGFLSLREIIETSVVFILIKHEIREFPIEIKLDSLDNIWGIKSQLNEVIYNLIDNAYEATQQLSDQLPLDERDNYHPKITVEAKEHNSHYLIAISDNGIGIKDNDKAKICSPFFTTKSSYKSGSGIGMYVSRRIIEENHNGKLWFESEHLKGTTFYIQLPKPS